MYTPHVKNKKKNRAWVALYKFYVIIENIFYRNIFIILSVFPKDYTHLPGMLSVEDAETWARAIPKFSQIMIIWRPRLTCC